MSLHEQKQNILRFFGNHLLYAAITLLCRTLSFNIRNHEKIKEYQDKNKNYILAFWHGTMLAPWYVHRDKNFAALVSKSKDGALLERVLKPWNYSVVRGSSHTGGSIALGILIDFAKNEKSVAITPDGPRGPAYKMKPGAVVTAKRSGIPLILLGVGYNRKRELRSWDKFQIPKAFSKVNLVYSDPIEIDPELSYEETSRILLDCECRLNELQKEAGAF